MGPRGSKNQIQELKRQQEALMKNNVELAEKVARQELAQQQQHQQTIEQMGQLLAVMMHAVDTDTSRPTESREIEIEGTKYQLTGFINRGGFGEIYKAQARNSKRIVAVKIMVNSPLIKAEIEHEIQFLSLTKNIQLANLPVIEYYGCQITKEHIFIAMELASCDLLSFWISQAAEKEGEDMVILGLIIIVYVLRALIFLEKLNIIHGDIKPQNLVIVQADKRFYIKLIDFGTVEKMDTRRAHLTVDATKAHSIFFASPEFVKRGPNNTMARYLHKKSDAWAAGVMFYILFLRTFPWKDQYDYENFCNDPSAEDVTVPQEGGYKLIIELLLKKNPAARSSALETLMQMKGHPALGVIIASLEESFCPVDDVCNMRVPESVRRDLGRHFSYD